jgi:hypothetical protein
VKRAQYRQRFDFFGTTQKVIDQDFQNEFDLAFARAMGTALLKVQGELL